MGDPSAEYHNASPSDLSAIKGLLADRELPVDDLTAASIRSFLLHRRDGHLVGCVGMELHGDVGLVRSLAVARSAEGTGLGSALVAALEALARREHLRSLFLLTTTAEDFFARRGYEVTKREDAPSGIQGTRQFSELCPASAAFMKKDL